jgi:hypothetical protein
MSVPGGDGAAVLFKGDANSIVFATATGYGAGNRGVELVSISAYQDREDISLVRNRGAVANPQPELRDPVVLMKGRMRVRFTYRDRNGKTAPTWIEQPELPAAVAIEIFGAQGNPILPVPALIALPQNYSVECFNPPSNMANIQVRCTNESNQQNANTNANADANQGEQKRR